MSALPDAPSRSPMCVPLWGTLVVCVAVVVSAGLSVWLQMETLRVFVEQGFQSALALALLVLPVVMGLAAWWVLVRLWFRRSLLLALRFVALVFLASLLALMLEFDAVDLDFGLQLLWLATLTVLFRALLLRRERHRAESAA